MAQRALFLFIAESGRKLHLAAGRDGASLDLGTVSYHARRIRQALALLQGLGLEWNEEWEGEGCHD